MKNITIITSTRAEYGLLRPVIQKVAAAQDLQLQLVVTGHISVPGLAIRCRKLRLTAAHCGPPADF